MDEEMIDKHNILEQIKLEVSKLKGNGSSILNEHGSVELRAKGLASLLRFYDKHLRVGKADISDLQEHICSLLQVYAEEAYDYKADEDSKLGLYFCLDSGYLLIQLATLSFVPVHVKCRCIESFNLLFGHKELRSGRAKILRDCKAYLKPLALSLADLGDYKCQESVLETLCRLVKYDTSIAALLPQETQPIFNCIMRGGDFDNLARNFLIKYNDLQGTSRLVYSYAAESVRMAESVLNKPNEFPEFWVDISVKSRFISWYYISMTSESAWKFERIEAEDVCSVSAQICNNKIKLAFKCKEQEYVILFRNETKIIDLMKDLYGDKFEIQHKPTWKNTSLSLSRSPYIHKTSLFSELHSQQMSEPYFQQTISLSSIFFQPNDDAAKGVNVVESESSQDIPCAQLNNQGKDIHSELDNDEQDNNVEQVDENPAQILQQGDIINIYGRKPTNKGSKDSNATLLSDEVLRDTSRGSCLGDLEISARERDNSRILDQSEDLRNIVKSSQMIILNTEPVHQAEQTMKSSGFFIETGHNNHSLVTDENCKENSLEEDLNEVIKSTLEANNSEEQESEDDCLEEIEAGSDSVPAISAAIKGKKKSEVSRSQIGMLKISSIAKDFGENIHQVSTQEHETIELNNDAQKQKDNSANQSASVPQVIHFQSGDNENNTVENDAIEERLTNTVAKKDKTIISDSDEDELDCSEKIEAGSDSVPAIGTPIKASEVPAPAQILIKCAKLRDVESTKCGGRVRVQRIHSRLRLTKLDFATKLEFVDKAVSFSIDTTNDSTYDDLKRTLNVIHEGLATPVEQQDDINKDLNVSAAGHFNSELDGGEEKEKASMQGDGTPLSTNPKGSRQTSRRGGRKRKTSQLYNKQFTKKGKVSAKIDAVVQQDKTKNMNNIQPNAIENFDLNIEVTENKEHVSTNADADDISTNVEMIDNNELEINEESSDTTRHVELFEDIIIDECNASEKVVKTTKNIRNSNLRSSRKTAQQASLKIASILSAADTSEEFSFDSSRDKENYSSGVTNSMTVPCYSSTPKTRERSLGFCENPHLDPYNLSEIDKSPNMYKISLKTYRRSKSQANNFTSTKSNINNTELEAEPKTYTHQRKRLFKISQQEKQEKTGTKSFFGSFDRAKNKSSTYQDKSDSDNESVDEAEPAAVNSSNNNISAADQSIFADSDDNNQQIENEDSTKDVEKPTTAQTKDANTTNYGTMTIKLKRNEGSSPRLSLSINNIRFSEMMSEKDVVEKTFRLTIEE